ncbi:MAG: DUF3794 domain-containing protein [Clostridia bacterium]|nr:DUF3794 domain-containing protein [Clostridia bacterium]
MSFEKSKCNFINKNKLKDEQILLDCATNLDNNGELSKILWINVYPQIDTTEPLTKEVSYSGKAIFEVVYLDSENKIKTAENTVPFLNKFINENILPTSKINIIPTVVEANYVENFDKIQALINLEANLYNCSEIEILNGGDENICIKEEEIMSYNIIKDDCITFNEELSYTINEKYSRILSVSSYPVVKEIIPDKDFFTIQGEVNTVVQYVTADEIEKVNKASFSEPFRREIEVKGLTENSQVEAFVCIKRDGYKFEIDPETKKVEINAPLNVCFKAFENIVMPYAVDIFSLKNNLEIVTNSYSKSLLLESNYFDKKIEGSTTLSDNEPRIDKMIGFSNGVLKPTNQFVKDNELFLEGIISFDVAYLNDELGYITTIKKEIPYSVFEKCPYTDTNQIYCQSKLCDMEIVSRRGRELFVDAKLKTFVTCSNQVSDAVITDVVLGEQLAPKEHAIEIYFGKTGDNIWDISKELKIQPNIILAQNPSVVLPLEQNENIVIYNQKN